MGGAILGPAKCIVHPRINLEAIACQLDGRAEQLRPSQLAMRGMGLRGERDIARHAHTQAAADRLHEWRRIALLVEEPVGRCTCRRRLASIECRDIAIGLAPHQEAATADAGTLWLDHRECQHYSDRCIGGAATLGEDRLARFLRARIGGAHRSCGHGGDRVLRRGCGIGRAPGEGERCERGYVDVSHGRRRYAVPTASAIEEKPSRFIRRSNPRVIARGRPGPS